MISIGLGIARQFHHKNYGYRPSFLAVGLGMAGVALLLKFYVKSIYTLEYFYEKSQKKEDKQELSEKELKKQKQEEQERVHFLMNCLIM